MTCGIAASSSGTSSVTAAPAATARRPFGRPEPLEFEDEPVVTGSEPGHAVHAVRIRDDGAHRSRRRRAGRIDGDRHARHRQAGRIQHVARDAAGRLRRAPGRRGRPGRRPARRCVSGPATCESRILQYGAARSARHFVRSPEPAAIQHFDWRPGLSQRPQSLAPRSAEGNPMSAAGCMTTDAPALGLFSPRSDRERDEMVALRILRA